MALPLVQPAVVRSKAPNGTHWFSDTPWVGGVSQMPDTQKKVVACSIEAIETAVDGLAALGVAAAKAKVDAGYAILVEDGTLTGGATGPFHLNTAIVPRVILENKGSMDWLKKLLITPKNGPGRVRVNGQIQFEGTKGIAWVGFPTFDPNNSRRYARAGYLLNNVSNFGWGWCETSSVRVNVNAGKTSKNVELKEWGWDEKITREGDYAGLGVNATGSIDGLLLEGFFLPAVYHLILVPWENNAPSKAHSDSWQIQSGPSVKNIVYRDGFSGASTNVAFQNGGYQALLFDNVQIAGGQELAPRLWPYEDNEATDGNVQAFNGSGSVIAVNCDVMGGLGKVVFLDGTTGTKIAYDWSGATRNKVTVDKTMLSRTPAQVFAISPKFTAARQAQIFGGALPPADTTPPSTPAQNVPVVAGRDVQLSWETSTDDVAVTEYIILRGTSIATAVEIGRTADLIYTDLQRPFSSSQVYLIRASDGTNLSPVSNARTAVIAAGAGDSVKPTVSILTPSAGIPVSGITIVQVLAPDNVETTEVSLWSGSQKLPGVFAKTSGDVWEGRLDSTKFPDGTYPIEAHALDAAKNEGISSTVNVTISNFVRPPDDTNPPSPEPIVTVTPTGLTSALVTWTASAEESGAPAKYRFKLDGAVLEVGITDLARDLTGLDSTRKHTVVIEAYGSNNVPAPSDEVSFTTWQFDTAGPTITLGVPAAGVLTADPQPFRFAAVDSGSDVQAVELHVGGLLVDTADRLEGDVWGTTVPHAALPAGTSEYRVRAVDFAGNESWSDPVSITVPGATPPDTTGPAVVIIEPNEGSVVPDFLSVVFTASDERSGVSSAEARTPAGLKLAEAEPLSEVAGTWVVRAARETLPVGSSQVVIRAFDGSAARNYTDVVLTVFVEAQPVVRTGTFKLLMPSEGITDAIGQPVSDGTLQIDQTIQFNTETKLVTRTPRTLDVEGGICQLGGQDVFLLDVPIPPDGAGIITRLTTPGARPDTVKWMLPPNVEDGDYVRLSELVRAGTPSEQETLAFLPSAAQAIEASASASASALRADASRVAAEKARDEASTIGGNIPADQIIAADAAIGRGWVA